MGSVCWFFGNEKSNFKWISLSLSLGIWSDIFSKVLMCKNGVLKFFAKFTVKHQCQSLFFYNEASKCCTYSANASLRSTILTPVQPWDIAAVSFLLTFNVLCLLGIIHLVLETVTVRCSVKKDVLKNFAKFTVNICARVSF